MLAAVKKTPHRFCGTLFPKQRITQGYSPEMTINEKQTNKEDKISAINLLECHTAMMTELSST